MSSKTHHTHDIATMLEAASHQHTAILGKTGSGKTSTGKLLIEQMTAAGARICILDPIKSDWWGLTSSADGTAPGLPFQILGGPRGHVPLHAGAGAAVAELVAGGALPLSIIDMAEFEPGGQVRFFSEFAPVMIKRMRGVLYLVVEEAHMFAPKERSGMGNENMSIHWAKTLATAGRSKGIRLVVLTQRTQSLHNALLGSCDTMIAHRFTAPADQKPINDWLKANVEPAIAAEVAASLSSLKTGQAWFCAGEERIFAKVHFPRIHTYDNTKTPTGDMTEHQVATSAVDIEALRTMIGTAIAEAAENDPKALHAEIERLHQELAKARDHLEQVTDTKAIDDAYLAGELAGQRAGREIGYIDGRREAGLDIAGALVPEVEDVLQRLQTFRESLMEPDPAAEFEKPPQPARAVEHHATNGAGPAHTHTESKSAAPRATVTVPIRRGLSVSIPVDKGLTVTTTQSGRLEPGMKIIGGPGGQVVKASAGSAAGNQALSKAHRLILTALAQYPQGRTLVQVATLTGYSKTGGMFRRAMGELRSAGWMEGAAENLKITLRGMEVLGPFQPLPTGRALLTHWLQNVTKSEREILTALAHVHPKALTPAEIGERAGYTPSGGMFRRSLGHLRTLDLIIGRGSVRLSDNLT